MSSIRDIAADTLSRSGIALPAEVLNDSLPSVADTAAYVGSALLVSPFRQAEAAEVFGAESFMPSTAVQPLPEAVSLTDNLPIQIATICLLLLYPYIIFRYGREIMQLFRMVFTVKKEERSTDDYNYLFADFITGVLAAGYLMTGIAAVKAVGLLADGAVLDVIQRQGPFLVLSVVSLTMAAVNIGQQLVMRIAGVVTLSIRFIRRLLSLRRLFFTVITVSATPAVLLFALADEGMAQIPGYAAAGIVAGFLIYYIYRSLKLFIEEKVSILLWMLYLCIVEVMPPAMILLATLRSI